MDHNESRRTSAEPQLWLGERLPLGRASPSRRGAETPLKVWLPKCLVRCLDRLGEQLWLSRSATIRFFLHGFLFGYYFAIFGETCRENSQEKEECETETRTNAERDSEPLKPGRRGPATTPALGKNAVNVKVWVPLALMDELTRWSARRGAPVSRCVREILAREVLGSSVLHDRTPNGK